MYESNKELIAIIMSGGIYLILSKGIFSHFCLAAKISERIIDCLKFSLVFFWSLIDDITAGLNSFCKDNLDISKVLCLERALLNQQQNKVHD